MSAEEEEQTVRSGKEYVVEKILSRKTVDGVDYYLLKWKGYPSSSNTWEPRQNLSNCGLLLQEFEALNPPLAAPGKTPPKDKQMLRLVGPGHRSSDDEPAISPSKRPQAETEEKHASTEMFKERKKKKKVSFQLEREPKAIVGVRGTADGNVEYAVELSGEPGPDGAPLVACCSSDYLATKCPMLLINYLESHMVVQKDAEGLPHPA